MAELGLDQVDTTLGGAAPAGSAFGPAPGYQQDPRARDESLTTQLALAVPRGVEGAVRGLYNFADFLAFDSLPDYKRRFLGQSQHWAPSLVEGLVTFGLPGGVALRATGAIGRASASLSVGQRLARGALAGAVTDFAVTDPDGGRLSDWARESGVDWAVTDFLSTKPDDSEAESRFKNALEGIVPGLVVDGVVEAFGAVRNLRNGLMADQRPEAKAARRAVAAMLRDEFGFDDAAQRATLAFSDALGLDYTKIRSARAVAGLADKAKQTLGNDSRAAVTFADDGTAYIAALANPDVTSAVHELSHIARRQLLISPEISVRVGINPKDVKVAAEWSGAKIDGGKIEWSIEAEEKFASGFERYVRDGVAPSSALERVYRRLSTYFRRVYRQVKGTALDVEISDEMRGVFDTMMQRNRAIREAKYAAEGNFSIGGRRGLVAYNEEDPDGLQILMYAPEDGLETLVPNQADLPQGFSGTLRAYYGSMSRKQLFVVPAGQDAPSPASLLAQGVTAWKRAGETRINFVGPVKVTKDYTELSGNPRTLLQGAKNPLAPGSRVRDDFFELADFNEAKLQELQSRNPDEVSGSLFAPSTVWSEDVLEQHGPFSEWAQRTRENADAWATSATRRIYDRLGVASPNAGDEAVPFERGGKIFYTLPAKEVVRAIIEEWDENRPRYESSPSALGVEEDPDVFDRALKELDGNINTLRVLEQHPLMARTASSFLYDAPYLGLFNAWPLRYSLSDNPKNIGGVDSVSIAATTGPDATYNKGADFGTFGALVQVYAHEMTHRMTVAAYQAGAGLDLIAASRGTGVDATNIEQISEVPRRMASFLTGKEVDADSKEARDVAFMLMRFYYAANHIGHALRGNISRLLTKWEEAFGPWPQERPMPYGLAENGPGRVGVEMLAEAGSNHEFAALLAFMDESEVPLLASMKGAFPAGGSAYDKFIASVKESAGVNRGGTLLDAFGGMVASLSKFNEFQTTVPIKHPDRTNVRPREDGPPGKPFLKKNYSSRVNMIAPPREASSPSESVAAIVGATSPDSTMRKAMKGGSNFVLGAVRGPSILDGGGDAAMSGKAVAPIPSFTVKVDASEDLDAALNAHTMRARGWLSRPGYALSAWVGQDGETYLGVNRVFDSADEAKEYAAKENLPGFFDGAAYRQLASQGESLTEASRRSFVANEQHSTSLEPLHDDFSPDQFSNFRSSVNSAQTPDPEDSVPARSAALGGRGGDPAGAGRSAFRPLNENLDDPSKWDRIESDAEWNNRKSQEAAFERRKNERAQIKAAKDYYERLLQEGKTEQAKAWYERNKEDIEAPIPPWLPDPPEPPRPWWLKQGRAPNGANADDPFDATNPRAWADAPYEPLNLDRVAAPELHGKFRSLLEEHTAKHTARMTLEEAAYRGLDAADAIHDSFGEATPYDLSVALLRGSKDQVRGISARLMGARDILVGMGRHLYDTIEASAAQGIEAASDEQLVDILRARSRFLEVTDMVREVQGEIALALGSQRVRYRGTSRAARGNQYVPPRATSEAPPSPAVQEAAGGAQGAGGAKDTPKPQAAPGAAGAGQDRPRAGTKEIPPSEGLPRESVKEILRRHGGRKAVVKTIKQTQLIVQANPGGIPPIPPYRGWVSMLPEYFVNSILSGPITHAVNFSTGIINTTVKPLEMAVGTVLTGRPSQASRELSELGWFVRESLESIKMGALSFQGDRSILIPEGGSVMEHRSFRAIAPEAQGVNPSSLGGRVLKHIGTAVNIPARFLTAEDEIIKAVNYRASLGRRLQEIASTRFQDAEQQSKWVHQMLAASGEEGQYYSLANLERRGNQLAVQRGLRGADQQEFVAAYVRQHWDDDVALAALRARHRARTATFTEDFKGGVADYGAGSFGETRGGAGINKAALGFSIRDSVSNISARIADATSKHPFWRLVVPFVRTPNNLMMWAADRTVGAVSDAAGLLLREEVRNASSAARRADVAGRLATGTALITTAAYWANQRDENGLPILTGAGPIDPEERKLWEATGWRPYSIRVGNEYVSYRRMDPSATFFGVVADLVQESAYSEMLNRQPEWGKALMVGVMNNLVNKTYLSGAINLARAMGSPASEFQNIINSYAAAAAPYSSAVHQVVNPLRGDDVIRELRTAGEAFRSRWILANPNSNAARRNVLGETVGRDKGVGPDLFSPLRTVAASDDPVMREFVRIGARFGQPQEVSNGLDLTRYKNEKGVSAYDRWQELHGEVKIRDKSLRQMLESTIASRRYQRLPQVGVDDLESPRVAVMRSILSRYRERAKRQMLQEFPQVSDDVRSLLLTTMSLRGGGAPPAPGSLNVLTR